MWNVLLVDVDCSSSGAFKKTVQQIDLSMFYYVIRLRLRSLLGYYQRHLWTFNQENYVCQALIM